MRKLVCLLIFVAIFCMVANAQTLPIIPQPNKVTFKKGAFDLRGLKSILISADSVRNEALLLQKILKDAGILVVITKKQPTATTFISLKHSDLIKGKEAYRLTVNNDQIKVEASSKVGFFYGLQTFKQLIASNNVLPAVEIDDAPAFVWRGYMVDVGRNFQSIDLLKQQIEVMASYKLNIFHFHFTEDIAWRLAIKGYPQLTDSVNMLRNKGKFYTENNFRELINFCKDRNITLVPEIDMPGHSASFKRAMGVEMQSNAGVHILKNILTEFFASYNLPYFHIGADEVKITNKNFIPEMTGFIEGFDKKTIGWEPGGNFRSTTIRQLWMDDVEVISGKNNIQYIDSRHLYLNHMDPLESVVTIFNRQLCDVDKGNKQALGATLCLWPDRAIAKEIDAIRMNAVYPSMLAFAERSWRGGGYSGWVANITTNGNTALNSFINFENRLLLHKKWYFKNLSFPYYKQSNLKWKLFGPFNNEGELSKNFDPEAIDFNAETEKASLEAMGGTIILRHWWAPKIIGILPAAAENTTWYAFTKIWSDRNEAKDFWIGFSNPSRSQATDSPIGGTWDNHKSKIWLNGKIVAPPIWQHAGQKGNLEIPLVDEGYEYRKPVSLILKEGWNIIRIKAPIGKFAGRNWNNPEKWMFTVIPLA